MKEIILGLSFLFFINNSFAISVGDITSILMPENKTLSKEVINTTAVARFVSVSVSRISSPGPDGKEIPMDNGAELLSTPASLIMPGDARENFRFIYNGPQDEKERYYRLNWVDEPVADNGNTTTKKAGVATTSAELGTILVVSPRKENFSYSKNGNAIYNTGNSSFRVISYGKCIDTKKDTGNGCKERYYILPGKKCR